MIAQFRKSETALPGERVIHRIAWLTLAFGLASALAAIGLHRTDWAKGLAGGAVLGWLNFRWLQRGIRAIFEGAVSQSDAASCSAEASRGDRRSAALRVGTYFALLFRYALVALGVYVIFIFLHVPLVSIGLGLCALVAAIITASVWEVVKPAG